MKKIKLFLKSLNRNHLFFHSLTFILCLLAIWALYDINLITSTNRAKIESLSEKITQNEKVIVVLNNKLKTLELQTNNCTCKK